MKKIAYILISLCMLVSSCDYLDIVPDDTATLDDAFKNETTAEGFVYTCYSYIPNYLYFRDAMGWCTSNEMVGGYHWTSQWFVFMAIQQGADNSSSPRVDYWKDYYQAIKQCYIFLNNIDKVSPVFMSPSVYEARKKEWIGEVQFLIAYYHHMLLMNYGPVVIVEGEITEKQPRLPYDQCVEKIAAMYDQAINNGLPLKVQPANYGRASQVVARAMKAKLLLYAASPLFNGNTDYANFKNKDGEQLISQTYDKNKWQTAMTAIDDAISFAKTQGHDLYEYKTKPLTDPFEKAYHNSRYVMVENWNSEVLWAYTGRSEQQMGNSYSFQTHAVPKAIGDRAYSAATPYGAISPTLAAAKIFYDANGCPPEKNAATWSQRMTIAPGDSTIQLHRNREPRFYAAIGYDRGTFEYNGDQVYTLYLRHGEKNGARDKGADHLYSGYAIKKPIHPEGQSTSSTWGYQSYAFPIVRLSDLYLAYAEACAEFNGTLDAKAKQYVTDIRTKAGIPDLETSYGKTLNGQELVDAIRRERMIELIFEGHWYYDLRRWKTAEEWHKDEKAGMWGLNDMGKTAEEFYQETRMTASYLIFEKRQNFLPIKIEWTTVNDLLVPNPGW